MWPAMPIWLSIGKWFFEIAPSGSSPFMSGRAIGESDLDSLSATREDTHLKVEVYK